MRPIFHYEISKDISTGRHGIWWRHSYFPARAEITEDNSGEAREGTLIWSSADDISFALSYGSRFNELHYIK